VGVGLAITRAIDHLGDGGGKSASSS